MASRGRGTKRRRGNDDGWGGWGGYMNAKMQKLQQQFVQDKASSLEGVTSNIFQGVSIFVNGYTNPSLDELKRMMMAHGGSFHHYYSRALVTHIIATNLPDNKVREVRDKKIIRPEWITDSIAAGKCLSYKPYQLYTAQNRLQPALNFKKVSETNAADNKDVNSGASNVFKTNSESELVGGDGTVAVNLAATATGESTMSLPDHLQDEDGIKNKHQNFQEQENNSPVTCDNTNTSNHSKDKTVDDNISHISPSKAKNVPAKAGDPEFVSEFYAHSRLHYISTWSAELKSYVSRLHAQENPSFPGREELCRIVKRQEPEDDGSGEMKPQGSRVIMHIDMDCFFVSVGLRERPGLKGKPVAVSHSKGKGMQHPRTGYSKEYEMSYYANKLKRKGVTDASSSVDGSLKAVEENDDFEEDEIQAPSVSDKTVSTTKASVDSYAEIASCSYEARKAGIKNGMFVGAAKKMCPELEFIPYNFNKYREVSQQLYDIVASYTHDIEAVSCDEMFVDCTELIASTGATPMLVAKVMRDEIFSKTRCHASAGLAENILLARMTTRVAKPNGQFYLDQLKVPEFIKKQPIKDLPGVGWSTAGRLQAMDVTTCGDLQKVSLATLQKEFGQKTGQQLYNNSRGLDNRTVKVEKERKSVSAEINYGIRFTQFSELEKFLKDLSEEVSRRLKKIGVKAKGVTLKLKVRKADAPKETLKFMGHGVCDNIAKSSTLSVATDDPKIIYKECLNLYKTLKLNVADLRGIGIQTQKLEDGSKVAKGGILNYARKIEKSQKCTEESTDTSAPPVVTEVQLTTRRRTAIRELPPLPTLPSLDSSEEDTLNSPPRIQSHTSRRMDTQTVVQSFLPSPSQLDPEVLKELPADIREQVLASYQHSSAGKRVLTSGPEPGCSHWQSQLPLSVQSSDEIPSSPIVALPSFSQIDPSCFEALPNDLQEELRKAYRDQVQPASGAQHPVQLKQAPDVRAARSPRKASPKSKNSPTFKAPRGRPARHKKSLHPTSLKFPESHSAVEGSAAPPSELGSTNTKSDENNVVSLCGASSLADVKRLLLDWLQSTEEPEIEDVNRIIQYFTELLHDKNMPQIDLVLKFLYRQLKKENVSNAWKVAFETIATETQISVMDMYGSKLKLLSEVLG